VTRVLRRRASLTRNPVVPPASVNAPASLLGPSDRRRSSRFVLLHVGLALTILGVLCGETLGSGSEAAPSATSNHGGAACFSKLDRVSAPISNYSVAEVGQPAVPKLSRAELATLHRIATRTHFRFLRFAFVPGPNEQGLVFVVFNAPRGPCPVNLPYTVLNLGPDLYYTPGINPRVLQHGPP